MSISDKQQLLRSVEIGLGKELTADNIKSVVNILSNILIDFNVEYISNGTLSGNDELLSAYIEAKRIEGRSEKTIERYQYIISKTINTIGVPIRDISVHHLRKYLGDLKDKGIANSTLEGIRQVLSAFFGWLEREKLSPSNPMINLQPIRITKKVRKPFSQVDIEQLKEGCTNNRDKAIISFLLTTGCRVSEVCALNRNDIDMESKEVVVFGKGNKERTVFVDDVTCMLLRRYLEDRKDDLPALFVGKGSERLKPCGIRKILTRISEKSNVKNTHPHRFRRTLATNLINGGMPIQQVSIILGHDKLDTTMKYIYSSKTDIKNAYEKYAS